ncbi:unnamed protein product [Amoebophrya sp. A120]|nr:unnamed protein product [Amoebophrya sp. A120]|eukprot:GSA120T00013369001.1
MSNGDNGSKQAKALEKERKAIEKIMNESDDMFCGFVKLQILDQDAYPRQIKGADIGGVVHVEKKEGGKVFLKATFSANPLFYLELQRDNNMFLAGEMWYGDAKRGRGGDERRSIFVELLFFPDEL